MVCDEAWDLSTYCCADEWAAAPVELQDRASRFATLVMWAATGRIYTVCPITVRPCLGNEWGLWNNWGVWGVDGTWFPYIWAGQWFNAFCGCSGLCCCEYKAYTSAWLPGPVSSVVSVDIGGITLDPSAYRVDDAQWLVRTDGSEFPRCQDFNQNAGLIDTWSVTYHKGRVPTPAVLDAAGTLACEYLKFCTGGQCRLPGRVTNIIRQGVQIELIDPTTLLDRNLTGLPEVDQVIVSINPFGQKAPMRLYSPDVARYRDRQTTWPQV